MFNMLKTRLKEGIKSEDIQVRDENVEILDKKAKKLIEEKFE